PDSEPPPAPPRVLTDTEKQQREQLLKTAQDLDKKLDQVESRFVSRALRNSDDKYFVDPDGVYLDLIWLNAEVGSGGGDVARTARQPMRRSRRRSRSRPRCQARMRHSRKSWSTICRLLLRPWSG